ncbi:MAG: universal stress protein [Chloroflexi bacterium]|nr:universal stress protein [Chloroflexota bacterium]
MYERILVPLDGSPVAEAVLPLVRSLAEAAGASVTLLHVIESVPPDRDLLAQLEARAAAYLRPWESRLAAAGIAAQVHVAAGRVAAQVLQVAQEGKHDLIALGTGGERALGGFYFGSTAWQVLHRAAVPVLLVRPPAAHPGPEGGPRIRRVLVPLDGSTTAEAVLPFAERLAAAFHADLYLVRVVSTVPVVFADPGVGPYLAGFQEDLMQEAQGYLDGVVQRLGARPFKVSSVVLAGPVAAQIVDFARRLEDSLVAMTTHGRTGMAGLVLGSVAAQVVQHSGDPVLLVRPGPGPR